MEATLCDDEVHCGLGSYRYLTVHTVLCVHNIDSGIQCRYTDALNEHPLKSTWFKNVYRYMYMSDRCMSDWCMSDRCMSDRCMSDRCMSDRCMSDRCMSDRCMSDRCMSDRYMSDRCMSEQLV